MPGMSTTLPEGKPATSIGFVTLNPSESRMIFKKKLEVLVTFRQYIRTLKKDLFYVGYAQKASSWY
jgi:hypothetical protein